MKRIFARRPQPATVIALLALFVSLGGVSYGFATGSIDSREILNGTIRSYDVRNDELTSRDLRNNRILSVDVRNGAIRRFDVAGDTLRGEQIDESRLERVPDAAALDGVPAAGYARAEAADPRVVGEVDEPAFENGAGAVGPPELEPAFWLDQFGTVRLEGSVDVASAGDPVFTLPPGHRPDGTLRFRVAAGAGAGATVAITADGEVVPTTTGTVALDGISFRAP